MATADPYESFQPFVSVTLAKLLDPAPPSPLGQCLADIEALCAEERVDTPFGFEHEDAKSYAPGLVAKALRYQRHVQPAWSKDKKLKDLQNHLVLAVTWRGHLALFCSDAKLKGRIASALRPKRADGEPLTWLSPMPRASLSTAFLERAQARTLWLSGIHRRTTTRADAKILAGQDLDDALDPFDDGSFYWSAARSKNPSLALTIGVAPASSRVWSSGSHSTEDFAGTVRILVDALLSKKASKEEPFRFLATPLETVAAGLVSQAYDLSMLPPYMLLEEGDAAELEQISNIVDEATFSVAGGKSADCRVEVSLNGQPVGSLLLKVSVAPSGTVKFAADEIVETGGRAEDFGKIAARLDKGAGVNIRYDSGHSISDRKVYLLRRARVDFRGFATRDFSGYDVTKEKPSDLALIGEEDSLFCWVQKTHAGWLACDDGSNEKADFIQLDTSGERPVLSLIHVKGANSASAARNISVAAYEVVTGQAVKNLIWIDRLSLIKGLESSARQANHWWRDQAPVTREEFVGALEALGDDFERRVVIVQPHLTAKAHDRAAKAAKGINRHRLDQLNLLLAGAWRACNGLGAEFRVLWSD